MLRMQVSISGNRNPNAQILISTPPPVEEQTDGTLLEALQNRGLRSILSQRSRAIPVHSEPETPEQSGERAPPAACMESTNPGTRYHEEPTNSRGYDLSPVEETVEERIRRKSFYPRFHDGVRAARRRSALWDTEYSGLWNLDREPFDSGMLRKSRSLWESHPSSRERSKSAVRAPSLNAATGSLWGDVRTSRESPEGPF